MKRRGGGSEVPKGHHRLRSFGPTSAADDQIRAKVRARFTIHVNRAAMGL